MSNKILTVLLIAILSINVGQAADKTKTAGIVGYGKTEWGMSPEKVLAAEPRAVKLESPVSNNDGSLGLIKIKELEIGNDLSARTLKFDATFIFEKSGMKLQRVQLFSENYGTAGGVFFSDFSDIEKLLTVKYGEPAFKAANKITAQSVTWKFPSTNITLQTVVVMQYAFIKISYESAVTTAAAAKDL